MLLVTLGDPFSVNVELAARVLAPEARATLVGSAWHWHEQLRRLGISAPAAVAFEDVGDPSLARPAETLTERERGLLSVRALERAIALSATVPRAAVLTAPIDKHACHAAGFAHPGQTEFFAEAWQGRAIMILAGPRLRVGLVTNHLALRDVAPQLTTELVAMKLELFARTLRDAFGIPRPRIAICGLNPHAGDRGLFGDEERRVIAPAIEGLRARLAAELTGPVPADTAFFRGYTGVFDGVLAMYHDQGLGPLKTVHFDDAINLSGGLKHLRVSPDHGPAQDLYLAGKASPKSFAAALSAARAYLEIPA